MCSYPSSSKNLNRKYRERKITSKTPISIEIFYGIFPFLSGNELQKAQLVSRAWNRFIQSNVLNFPLLLVPYVKLIKSVDAQKRMKTLTELPSCKNYAIHELYIFNDSFDSPKYFGKRSKKPQMPTSQWKTNGMNRPNVVTLFAEYKRVEPLEIFLGNLNETIKHFRISLLNLKLLGERIFADSSNWQNFFIRPKYKELVLDVPVNFWNQQEERKFIEWISSNRWTPDGNKKWIILEGQRRFANFIQEYVEFFLRTEFPNQMFKLLSYRERRDYFYFSDEMPIDYFLRKNIFAKTYNCYTDYGYTFLIEDHRMRTNRRKPETKELYEIWRDDDYVLRILAHNLDHAMDVAFSVTHRDNPPKMKRVPAWPVFPLAPNQLGFDYVDMDGNLLGG